MQNGIVHSGFPGKRSRHSLVCAVSTIVILAALIFPSRTFASFGVTSSDGYYIADTGAGLVFKINQSNGDMTSVRYNGIELNNQSKASYIASGLGSATVTATSYDSNYIKITVQTSPSNKVVSNLTHYYIVKNGVNNIYMATYVTSEPAIGELRYIFRGQKSVLPNGPVCSNNNGENSLAESRDIFGHPDGTTTSKFYGNSQAMNLTTQGASGNGVGVYVAFGNRESSSGGPFFHDIENQGGGSEGKGAGSDQQIYNYMNSGHAQTEAFRMNVLNGPYAFCFTSGGNPGVPDMNFIAELGLTGYVPSSGRGKVQGTVSGLNSGTSGVVGFANTAAQYWATVSGGSYSCVGMKPGTYTATLYQGELAVANCPATVTAGGNTTVNLSSTLSHPATIWKTGTWDGTPLEFLNGGNISKMHPSDVRNSNWGPITFTVASSPVSSFPAVQFRIANTPTTIKFELTPAQVAAHTLRIGITCAFHQGRPVITMNPETANAWTSPVPEASNQPTSRSITVGTYRGNNTVFTYDIPASAFIAGTNIMQINVASGISDMGPWLSAGWVYDCVELDN